MKIYRKRVLSSALAVLCAGLVSGCGDVEQKEPVQTKTKEKSAFTYSVNGRQVRLGDNGPDGDVSLLADVKGDLNQDGLDDRAVIIVQDGAGSGVFYFLNVFLVDGQGRFGLIGEELLGDRIKFDSVDIYQQGSVSSITGVPIHPDDYGQIMVAFSVRMKGQSLADGPGMYLTKHWRVRDGKLSLIENY